MPHLWPCRLRLPRSRHPLCISHPGPFFPYYHHYRCCLSASHPESVFITPGTLPRHLPDRTRRRNRLHRHWQSRPQRLPTSTQLHPPQSQPHRPHQQHNPPTARRQMPPIRINTPRLIWTRALSYFSTGTRTGTGMGRVRGMGLGMGNLRSTMTTDRGMPPPLIMMITKNIGGH